ncbi:MAG TPA: flagellar hook-associated protein FlgL [Rubrivivax sp.]|nr:flagellar hook-associated protein FlgL [Rubrivivax sp.]
MRIATAFAFDTSLANLQRRQQALVQSQEQLTSGKRVLRASDDPTAAAQAERALAALSRAESQGRALDASRNAMQLAEGALGDAGEMLAQARELIISAGNGSYSDSQRRTIAEAVRGLRDDLFAVSNRTDGTGRYVFGGQGSGSPPLVDGPGGVSYVGAPGHLNAAAGEPMPLSIDGRAAWLQASDPANPGSTLSVFDVLDTAINELLTGGRTSAQVAQTVSTALAGVDVSAGNLSAWRSRTGEALNRADGIEDRLAQSELDAQRERSTAVDLDMVSAISDFQNRQTGYDAALKTYSIVQKMSLFDYLK